MLFLIRHYVPMSRNTTSMVEQLRFTVGCRLRDRQETSSFSPKETEQVWWDIKHLPLLCNGNSMW